MNTFYRKQNIHKIILLQSPISLRLYILVKSVVIEIVTHPWHTCSHLWGMVPKFRLRCRPIPSRIAGGLPALDLALDFSLEANWHSQKFLIYLFFIYFIMTMSLLLHAELFIFYLKTLAGQFSVKWVFSFGEQIWFPWTFISSEISRYKIISLRSFNQNFQIWFV